MARRTWVGSSTSPTSGRVESSRLPRRRVVPGERPACASRAWEWRRPGVAFGPVAELALIEGDELIRVVGTSHYRDALLALSERKADEEVRLDKIATLSAEPDNPHDPDAIAVHIDDSLVGYLSRDENRRWTDVVPFKAEAMIAGKQGTTGLGVFLRLPTPTEARAQIGLWQRGREAR